MNVLRKLFDPSVNQASPYVEDVQRVVLRDENGNEKVTFKSVDYPKLQKSNGKVQAWSLNALLKAGINPDFPIHTGNNTRLEGVNVVNSALETADSLLSPVSTSESD